MRSRFPRPWWHTLFLVLLAATCVVATACGDSSPTEPETPVQPLPPERITETFTGALVQAGSVSHPFTVAVPGDIEMTITSIQPLETLTVGMGIGTTTDGTAETCAPFAQDFTVRRGETLLAQAPTGGGYCVFVFDVGNIFPGVTIDYSVNVTHP